MRFTRFLLLTASLISLISSCSIRQTKQSLASIESLLADHPDSALQLLQTFDRDFLKTSSLRAQYALLYSMALDKNYYDVDNDSTIRRAVDYYSRKEDFVHSMLAWYYLGRVQMNGGNIGEAAVSFNKAERLTDNPHWKGLIYRNLGDLYSQSLDPETAASYFRLSAECFQEAQDLNYKAYSSFNLARSLDAAGQRAAAAVIWTDIQDYAQENDIYLSSQIMLAKASQELSKTTPDPASVISWIKKGYALSKEPVRGTDQGNLALAYALMQKKDSSQLYYTAALSCARTPQDSAKLYAIRYRIEDFWGNDRQANQYLEKAMSIQNNLMNKRESMTIANSLARFSQEEETATRTHAKRNRNMLLSLIGLLVISVILLIQLIRNHRLTIIEQDKQLQRDMERTEEILQQLESMKHDKDETHRAIRTTILDQLSLIKRWSDAYYGIVEPEKPNKKDPGRVFDDDYIPEAARKEMVLKQFQQSLESLRSDDSLFRHLEDDVNLWKQNLMARARIVCHEPGKRKQNMDESDFKTMMLMFAEVPDKTIAYLIGLNYGAVRMRRVRYKEFFQRLKPEEAVVFLKEL